MDGGEGSRAAPVRDFTVRSARGEDLVGLLALLSQLREQDEPIAPSPAAEAHSLNARAGFTAPVRGFRRYL